nr:MAG TPA: 5'-nucleotidase [Caudoviricetes sp.]
MLEKIFKSDYLKRLDNIKQWQEVDVFKEESVAQHSYKVAVFARVLLEDLFARNSCNEILKFKLDCVTHAMFHDWDEALILRDMSHKTKYNSYNGEEIRESLNHLTKHLVEEEFAGEEDSAFMLRKQISFPDPIVKTFCKLCDWLALQFYVERELSLGNKYFADVSDYCLENIRKSAANVKDVLIKRFGLVDYKVLDKIINYGEQ